jgi:hypothetical protein
MRVIGLVFVLLSLAVAGPARAMSFQLAPLDDGRCGYSQSCPMVVRAVGKIESDDAERLQSFLGRAAGTANVARTLVIHSAGGHMMASIRMGILLRALRFQVIPGMVSGGQIRRGICGSACVFVLMGGERRTVPAGSIVAIHRPKLVSVARLGSEEIPVEISREDLREITGLLSRYSSLMGVDRGMIALMMTVPHSSRRILTAAEMRRFRLANGG